MTEAHSVGHYTLPPSSFAHASNFNTKRKLQLCSPQYAFAIIKPPMSQGHREGKVKLLTMNQVAAGLCLSDMGLKIWWVVRNSLTFLESSNPSFEEGKLGICSICWCTWDCSDSWKTSGTSNY